MNPKKLDDIFGTEKPLIGMIHLGDNDPVSQGISDIKILEEYGFHGAIVENYHGTREDVYDCLSLASKLCMNITLGVNVLGSPYTGLKWADEFGARFVQFDSVMSNAVNEKEYFASKEKYQDIAILGGVRFKYTKPTGRSREEDIVEGLDRCDVIVTTGSGTGRVTPMDKLEEFRRIMGREYQLIVGAGVTPDNIREQLEIADGAIIGSGLKKPTSLMPSGNTRLPIESYLVQKYVSAMNL